MRRAAIRPLVVAAAVALLAGCFTDPATRREQIRDSAFDLYSEGLTYKRHRNYVRARDKFLAAAEVSPRPAFHYEVAHAHWRLGNLEQAATWYERALAEAPDYDLARSELDLVRLQMMDRQGRPVVLPEPVLDDLTGTAEPDPAMVEEPAVTPSRRQIAQAAASGEQAAGASPRREEAAPPAAEPTPTPAAPAAPGVAGGFFGTLRESIEEFRSGTTDDPRTGRAREIDPALARAILFPELAPEAVVDPAAERQLARDAEQLGRWDEAVRRWVRVVDRQPGDVEARTALARALGKSGSSLRARDEFEKITARFPDHAPGWLAYGNFLVETRRYEEAADAYRRASALMPGDPAPWNNLAALHIRRNNPTAARDAALRLNEAHPDFAPGWLNRALAEDQLGSPDRALEALEQYLALSGDRRPSLERWGVSLRERAGRRATP